MNAHRFLKTVVRSLVMVAVALVLIGATGSAAAAQEGPIYEVRDYHIAPESLADYTSWAENHGVPHLKQHFDVVGFWVDTGVEPEVRTETTDPLGSANVTWIIRWESKAERDAKLGEVFGSPEWSEIFSRLPGGLEIYQRIQSRFLTGI
jgi:hypothetical protein